MVTGVRAGSGQRSAIGESVKTEYVGGLAPESLSLLPGWEDAMAGLRRQWDRHGETARTHARDHASLYQGRAAAMVFDVAYSRQRRYGTRVTQQVREFEDHGGIGSLEQLATDGPGDRWGLRKGEATTMQDVAAGLLDFPNAGSDDEWERCRAWASWADFGIAYELDPYVGQVRGIGLALFHYMRMRAGGDTMKPDSRTRKALRDHGFPIGNGRPETVYLVAAAAASELGVTMLELDQLLWVGSDNG